MCLKNCMPSVPTGILVHRPAVCPKCQLSLQCSFPDDVERAHRNTPGYWWLLPTIPWNPAPLLCMHRCPKPTSPFSSHNPLHPDMAPAHGEKPCPRARAEQLRPALYQTFLLGHRFSHKHPGNKFQRLKIGKRSLRRPVQDVSFRVNATSTSA